MCWTLKRVEQTTNHLLVLIWFRWQGRIPDGSDRQKWVVRVCLKCLAEDPVKKVFNSHLRQTLNHILDVVGDSESNLAMFRAAIAKVAVQRAMTV